MQNTRFQTPKRCKWFFKDSNRHFWKCKLPRKRNFLCYFCKWRCILTRVSYDIDVTRKVGLCKTLKALLNRFMDSDYNYGLDMDFLSVRTTSLDNKFCQLRFSEIYRMSSVLQSRKQEWPDWEQNKDKGNDKIWNVDQKVFLIVLLRRHWLTMTRLVSGQHLF